MNKQKKAFTLVELSVTIMIIAILASIGFYSYVGYIGEARDAERTADMGILTSALNLYKQNKGGFPIPGNYFTMTNNGTPIVYQGKMNKSVTLSTLDKLPFDPYKSQEYVYSISKNKQEAQIAMTLENGDYPSALLDGNYKSVSNNVLPTIILAIDEESVDIEINEIDGSGAINRQKFILDKGENLPYSMKSPFDPVYGYESTDLWDVISSGNVNYWQNSSYRTCTEIDDAGKSIGDGDYELLNDTGTLTSSGCTF